jgi:hypothetical protein
MDIEATKHTPRSFRLYIVQLALGDFRDNLYFSGPDNANQMDKFRRCVNALDTFESRNEHWSLYRKTAIECFKKHGFVVVKK